MGEDLEETRIAGRDPGKVTGDRSQTKRNQGHFGHLDNLARRYHHVGTSPKNAAREAPTGQAVPARCRAFVADAL